MWLLILAACRPCPGAAPLDADLTLVQLHLRGPALGESMLVVGPDGTTALIDVGNDAHAGRVRDALAEWGEAGAVDWVVLTHWHADHVGGFGPLFDPDRDGAVAVRQGVISRGGPTTDDSNTGEVEEVCDVIDRAGLRHVPLCGDPCSDTPCTALTDELGTRSVLDLGGARLELWAASGHGPDGDLGVDLGDDENARSLAGTVVLGDFTYAFAGDLTGGGKDTPDVETALAAAWPGPPAEVLHLSHHGIRSSTSDAWLDRWLPDDGATRHALVGSNKGYLRSPSPRVLERVVPRLGDGAVWAPAVGSAAGRDPALHVGRADVVVEVTDGGAEYRIGFWDDGGVCGAQSSVANP